MRRYLAVLMLVSLAGCSSATDGPSTGSPQPTPTATVTDLQPGTTYRYVVVARDTAGNSSALADGAAAILVASESIFQVFSTDEQVFANGEILEIRDDGLAESIEQVVEDDLTTVNHQLFAPEGFGVRVVMRAGINPVTKTAEGTLGHNKPDGGAVFGLPDGGWIYSSNSETSQGGVGALRFDATGCDGSDGDSLSRGVPSPAPRVCHQERGFRRFDRTWAAGGRGSMTCRRAGVWGSWACRATCPSRA